MNGSNSTPGSFSPDRRSFLWALLWSLLSQLPLIRSTRRFLGTWLHRLRVPQLIRHLDAIVAWQPFTLRGVMALAFALLLLTQYAFPESDLMAGILGEALLILCVVTALVALGVRFLLGRRLQASLHIAAAGPSSGFEGGAPPVGGAVSQRDVPAGITLEGSSLLPYFSLRIERDFLQPGVDCPIHIVRGLESKNSKRHLLDTIRFPHRGLWRMQNIRCELNDALGLTKFRWSLPNLSEVEVSAPSIVIQPLPVVAASSQSGDQLSIAKERSGDLFDIKAYDPSDGAKRILWKTYAKSRQVVVRRPEPAIVPEGEVAAYLVANPADDHVAGALQGYLQQLHDHNIVVLFGTDGFMADSPLVQTGSFDQAGSSSGQAASATPATASRGPTLGSGSPQFFCSDAEEIQRAINRSVWSRLAGTGQGFESYMDDLANHAKQIHHVLVFAAEPVGRSRNRLDSHWVDNIARVCAVYQAKLSIALVPAELTGANPPITPLFEDLFSSAYDRLRSFRSDRFGPRLNPGQLVRANIANTGAELLEVEEYR